MSLVETEDKPKANTGQTNEEIVEKQLLVLLQQLEQHYNFFSIF
jgi:hypothetical protein